jgi:hypothetical protein
MTEEQLNGFSLDLILGSLTKCFWHIPVLVKIR